MIQKVILLSHSNYAECFKMHLRMHQIRVSSRLPNVYIQISRSAPLKSSVQIIDVPVILLSLAHMTCLDHSIFVFVFRISQYVVFGSPFPLLHCSMPARLSSTRLEGRQLAVARAPASASHYGRHWRPRGHCTYNTCLMTPPPSSRFLSISLLSRFLTISYFDHCSAPVKLSSTTRLEGRRRAAARASAASSHYDQATIGVLEDTTHTTHV